MSGDQPNRYSRKTFLKTAAVAGAGAAIAPASSFARMSVTEAPRVVTLRMLMVSGQQGFWTAAADGYNASQKHTRLKLDISQDSNDNIKTTYKTNLASHNPPDLVYIFAGQRFIKDVADAGLVADLHAYEAQYGWDKRFDPQLFADFRYKNKLQQIGYATAPHAFVWYNKDLFAKLGLHVPANRQPTLSQFRNYVKVSHQAGMDAVALGDEETWPGGHFVTMMCLRQMQLSTLAKLRKDFFGPSAAKWTDPGPIRGLQSAQNAVKEGWFPKGLVALTDGDAQQMFATGKSTMYQTGYWAVQTIPPLNPNLNMDFFHYPKLNHSVPISLINFAANGITISAKSKHIPEAAALVNYAISRPGQKTLLEKFNVFPATKLLKGAKHVSYPNKLWPSIVSEVAKIPNTPFQIENDTPPSVAPQALSDLQGLLAGSISPQAWAKKFQSELDASR